MDDFDIPIFKKSYELYKTFYGYRLMVSKQDRYTLWQRCENTILDLLENILLASQLSKEAKLPALEKSSLKLNLLRILLRLSKETKAIDNKKYLYLEEIIDEIGRMLGGWIKSTKDR
ncbi:MAG: four helix bundle protein [Candidatus Harrisonbacteria bacterium]|nr:four helix bundle protein [Candidatus Harrisonbacteria bacterium]